MAANQPQNFAQKGQSISVTNTDVQTESQNFEQEPHGLCTCGQVKIVNGIKYICRKDAFDNCVWQKVM
ncbi:hypothetical protein SAMN05518672_11574 [Chitinophaga sp. CF118]|nr:hypothetical protein SAMN05518672_11574 [Chitinophaga sp. CF118]